MEEPNTFAGLDTSKREEERQRRVTAVARELAGFVWAVAVAAERGRAAR